MRGPLRFHPSGLTRQKGSKTMAQMWEQRSVWKGLVSGLVGGFVGSWTMNEFQKGWDKAANAMSDGKPKKKVEPAEYPTAKTAQAIAKTIVRKPLTQEQKRKAGPVVHYAFGTLLGGLYGATSEFVPKFRTAAGVPYGAAVFAAADEVALPALKLAKWAPEYPVSRHMYGLSSHIVWSTTTEAVRRLMRWAL